MVSGEEPCPLVLGPVLCAQGRVRTVAATNLSSGSAFLKNLPGPASSELGLNQRFFGTSRCHRQVLLDPVTPYQALSHCSLGGWSLGEHVLRQGPCSLFLPTTLRQELPWQGAGA